MKWGILVCVAVLALNAGVILGAWLIGGASWRKGYNTRVDEERAGHFHGPIGRG